MKRTKRNVVANFVGQGVTALLVLICTPLYKRLLGIEGVGIVSLYFILQSFASLLDFGFNTTLNREVAAATNFVEKRQHVRDLLHTMQVTCWFFAAVIAGVIALLAPMISLHWLKPENLSKATILASIFMMAPAIAFYWLTNLYSAGILGLQRQVRLNLISIAMDMLRFVGSALMLLRYPSLPVFFAWLAVINAFHCSLVGFILWHIMPKTGQRAVFGLAPILKVWKFAAGVGSLGVTSLLLTQMDKVLLSRLLPLSQFGYYSLAALIAGGLSRLFGPVFMALFPRFSQLIAANDMEHFVPFYHRSCQLMSVILLPIAAVLAVFPTEVMLIWMRDPATASNVSTVITILVLGTTMNGLTNLPAALQLAYGWTRLGLVTNTVLIVIMIPLLFVMVTWWGVIGAAMVWAILNAIYVFIGVPIMHSRLLKGELATWYVKDIARPLLGVLLVVVPAKLLMQTGGSTLHISVMLISVLAGAFLAAVLATPAVREWLRNLSFRASRGVSV